MHMEGGALAPSRLEHAASAAAQSCSHAQAKAQGVADKTHARFSPSAANRRIHCPPSLLLEEQFEEGESVYAAEGTAGHALAEHLIRKHLKQRTTRLTSEYYKDELLEAVDEYVSFVIGEMYTPRQDGERVQTSNLSDKTAQIALDYQERRERINREWYEQMEKELQMVSDEVTFFEAAVHALPIKIRGAVSALFIGQDTWDTVQADFHIGRATLSAYRRQALRILEMLHAVYQSRAIYNPRQKAIYSEETGPNLTEMNEKWDHWGWSKYVKH